MLREQGELLKLLDEIDMICDRLRIRYYLVGHLLQNALKDSVVHGYDASVAMTWDDFCVFREYIEKNFSGKRAIEGLDENRRLPKLFYRYINKETLLLDLDYARLSREYGIYVNFCILQKNNRITKVLSWMNRARDTKAEEVKGKKTKIMDGVFRVLNMFAPSLYAGWMAEQYKKNAWKKGDGKAPVLLSDGIRKASFTDDFDQGNNFVTLFGHRYRTVLNPAKYMVKQYGTKWKKKRPRYLKENYMVITNPSVDYDSYQKDPYMKQINDEFYAVREKYLKDKDMSYEPYNRKEKVGWNYLFSAEARIQCWKKYMPMKAELQQLWNEGRHDEVMMILKDYRDAVNKYAKKKIAVCFDPDIWEMYLEWLCENGNVDECDKLKEMVWPEHLKPIDTPETNVWLKAHV